LAFFLFLDSHLSHNLSVHLTHGLKNTNRTIMPLKRSQQCNATKDKEEKIKTERAISGIISCNWGQLAKSRFVVCNPDPGNRFHWALTVAPVGYANSIWVTHISRGHEGEGVAWRLFISWQFVK